MGDDLSGVSITGWIADIEAKLKQSGGDEPAAKAPRLDLGQLPGMTQFTSPAPGLPGASMPALGAAPVLPGIAPTLPGGTAPSLTASALLGSTMPGAGAEPTPAPIPENDEVKKAKWSQLFSSMQQIGMADRSMQYAAAFRELRDCSKEYMKQYNETIASEELLYHNAMKEALRAKTLKEQEMPAFAEVQATPARTPMQAAGQDTGQKDAPLPKRPGTPACPFYMRTGTCKYRQQYGVPCRWDHPDLPDGPKA